MVAEPGRAPFRMTEELNDLTNIHTALGTQTAACPPEFHNTVGFPILQNFQLCFLNTGRVLRKIEQQFHELNGGNRGWVNKCVWLGGMKGKGTTTRPFIILR